MKQSLSYYFTLLIIKLKGLKKNFSEDPVNFKKIRKEDVYHPKGKYFNQKQSFTVSNSRITEINPHRSSNQLLLFIHGGAFISGPAQHHWDSIKEIAKKTNYKIWLCDYPKAPEHQIAEISKNIDEVYATALENYLPNQITIIGDSVGGTLTASLVQRLIKKEEKLPSKIILISPVMDATLSNPDIDHIVTIDPILSKAGILSAKKMCAGKIELNNPMISPLYGSFKGFPETVLFLAENDITYPDQKLTVEKLTESKVNLEVIIGRNMPHIWPFLPVMKEAKMALNKIIRTLNN